MSAGFDASVAGIRETCGQVKAWQARAEEAEARVAELRAELAKWKSAAETAETERDALRQSVMELSDFWRRQAADDRDEATELGKRGLSEVARAPRRAAAVRENHAAALRAVLRKLVTA